MLNIIVSQASGQAGSCEVDRQSGSVGWVILNCCDGEVLTGDLLAEDGTVDMIEPIVAIFDIKISIVRIGGCGVVNEKVDGGRLNEAVRHVGVQLGDASVN